MSGPDIPIPREIRAYEKVDPPKLKKDYGGQLVRAHTLPARSSYGKVGDEWGYVKTPETLIPPGSVLTLRRRYPNGKEGVLVCDWPCPTCGHKHERSFNDSAVTDGTLEFVEENGLESGYGYACVYLATPYTDDDLHTRRARWADVSRAAAILINQGHLVISPISMWHPISEMGCAGDWRTWKKICLRLMRMADSFVIFHSPASPASWQESTGVRAERDFAITLGLPLWHAEFTDAEKNDLRITSATEKSHAA